MFFDTTLEKQLKDFVDTGCHIAIVKDIVEVEGADNEYKILGNVGDDSFNVCMYMYM